MGWSSLVEIRVGADRLLTLLAFQGRTHGQNGKQMPEHTRMGQTTKGSILRLANAHGIYCGQTVMLTTMWASALPLPYPAG